MRRVCIVCEGQTEETFVRDVLAPAFYDLGLNLIPEMVETSPGHKGGALKYDRVKRHLRNTLRQNSAPVVTILGNAVPNARLLRPAIAAARSGRRTISWITE